MKNKMIPDYPIMYKMSFTKGRPMKFQFDDFLFSYVYSGEGTMCVSGINHPLSKGCGWILARNEHISFHTGEFHASSTYPHIGRGCNRISVTCCVSGYDRCRK